MEQRITQTTVVFSHPFALTGIDVQPAGAYRVEAVDGMLDSLSCLTVGYRRISTTIELPSIGGYGPQRQLVLIDRLELEAALGEDAEAQRKPEQVVSS
jgi:hypothetical protein